MDDMYNYFTENCLENYDKEKSYSDLIVKSTEGQVSSSA